MKKINKIRCVTLGLLGAMMFSISAYADDCIVIDTPQITYEEESKEATEVKILGDDTGAEIIAIEYEEVQGGGDHPTIPCYTDIGEFKITYYCMEKRKHICGTGTGLTASGTEVREGVCAVDPSVIPLGSIIVIDGKEYSCEDTGGAIKGRRIDIAVPSHKEALELGTSRKEVYIRD